MQTEHEFYCEVCEDGGNLILCDTCPKSFHQECIKLTIIPDGKWSCPICVSKINCITLMVIISEESEATHFFIQCYSNNSKLIINNNCNSVFNNNCKLIINNNNNSAFNNNSKLIINNNSNSVFNNSSNVLFNSCNNLLFIN